MVQAGIWVQEAPPARGVGKGLHAPVLHPLLYSSHEPMSNAFQPCVVPLLLSEIACTMDGSVCHTAVCLQSFGAIPES